MHALRMSCLAAAMTTLLAGSGRASAMVWAKIDPRPEIVTSATLAFRGQVIDVTYGEVQVLDRPYPYTETRFKTKECFRGCRSGEEVTIRQLGGIYRSKINRALMIPGLPEFAMAKEYFVFANDQKEPFYGARFGEQGAFIISRDDQVLDFAGAPIEKDATAFSAEARSLIAAAKRPSEPAQTVTADAARFESALVAFLSRTAGK